MEQTQFIYIGQYHSQFVYIPQSTPQSFMHLLLIFKFYIYSARNTKQLNFDNLKKTIKKIKHLEKELTGSNKLKLLKKCRSIDHNIDWKVKRAGGPEWLIPFLVYFCSGFLFVCCFSFFPIFLYNVTLIYRE